MTDSAKALDQWLAPEGAGKPLACLATSFTFDADFFEQQCLSRFLGLDWKRGEGVDDLPFLIEQEEKLAETRVGVIVDRASATEGRSLRWDLLPTGLRRGGVMHAKVSLLVWEGLVRGIVGSANLTPAGYRRQLEAQIVLDAYPNGDLPTAVMQELIDALGRLVRLVPGRADGPGPKREALATLDNAEARLVSFGERVARRGSDRIGVVVGAPGSPVLDQLDRFWRGGRARAATVLSPYFDVSDESSPAVDALVDRLAARGPAKASFVLAAEQVESHVRLRAPASLISSLPDQVQGKLCQLRQAADEEQRILHAKAILLESEQEIVALVGSSNFTAAGLGVSARPNLEVNVAVGARRNSATGRALRQLIPAGDEVAVETVEWVEPSPAEEPQEPELPWGFVQALLDLQPEPSLRLILGSDLPSSWSVHGPDGEWLTDASAWERGGSPAELRIMLPDRALPYFLSVTWRAPAGELRATWPVNVSDKAALPPPEELRHLPVDALLRALASTRPLHESLSRELRAIQTESAQIDELDPLRRFDGSGQLLRRAKQVSMALAGLSERLERPAASEEALTWRLRGPFGPVAIAEGLIEQARRRGGVPGETSFLLAELALTLSRVDWRNSGRLLRGGTRKARRQVREVVAELDRLRAGMEEDPRLSEYVERAFVEARR